MTATDAPTHREGRGTRIVLRASRPPARSLPRSRSCSTARTCPHVDPESAGAHAGGGGGGTLLVMIYAFFAGWLFGFVHRRFTRGSRVCNAEYGFNGWLGLASINLDSRGHITQGTAKVNDSYSSYFASQDERRHVMCQEIGHLFGLGHTSEDGSTQNTYMDYSNSPTSTAPNQHDYDQLAAIYAHNSYNSYATGAARTAQQAAMAGPPPMGMRVRKGVFDETWVAPDGKGGIWVHHVILAPGHEHTELLPRK